MIEFTKMQGAGNDYVYIDTFHGAPENLPALAKRVSVRHFGIGSDGLIVIGPGSDGGDFRMDIYNPDGSRAEMCGNGLRCAAKYVYDKGMTQKTVLTFDTLAGPRQATLLVEDGKVAGVTADMGVPQMLDMVPSVDAGPGKFLAAVSMGNPHAVFLTEDVDAVPLRELGPLLERDPAFPHRTNVEFVEPFGPSAVRMRVWERGTGETLACGTGACAVYAALRAAGMLKGFGEMQLPGGVLYADYDERGHILLTGPAVTVFEGRV